jgi:hypothetical protein
VDCNILQCELVACGSVESGDRHPLAFQRAPSHTFALPLGALRAFGGCWNFFSMQITKHWKKRSTKKYGELCHISTNYKQ